MNTTTRRIKLWDLPTRIFHWLLVLLIVAAIVTGKIGGYELMIWHGRIGLAILGLIAFRIIWGLAGSTYARFINFVPAPRIIVAYVKGEWRGVGHNPLGAFSVIAMLLLIALQVATGLFSNHDSVFQGGLFSLINVELSNELTDIHHNIFNALLAMIVLHLGAIVFYTQVRKDDLVRPMITGWKDIPPNSGSYESAKGGGFLALVIALAVAGGAVYAGSGKWIPEPAAHHQETQTKFQW